MRYLTPIDAQLTDAAVLEELGSRVQHERLARNVTQARLAASAGVSLPTVQRVEAGCSVQLVSFLKVLRALGLIEQVEQLVPSPRVRPMELLVREGSERQRASSNAAPEPTKPWDWGE